jgi:hypothetical protein
MRYATPHRGSTSGPTAVGQRTAMPAQQLDPQRTHVGGDGAMAVCIVAVIARDRHELADLQLQQLREPGHIRDAAVVREVQRLRLVPCTRPYAPAGERQAGAGAAMPLRGTRCAGAGAFVTSGGRPHCLPHEAPAAGRHDAPALHRAGTVTACGVPGASASGKPHPIPRRPLPAFGASRRSGRCSA